MARFGLKQSGLTGLFILQGAMLFGMCIYVLHSHISISLRMDDLQAQLDTLGHGQVSKHALRSSSSGNEDSSSVAPVGYYEHGSSYTPRRAKSVILVMAKTDCTECNFQGWSDNCVFVHSLRKTGYDGDVVFFVNNINDQIAERFREYNISYILNKGRFNLDDYDLKSAGILNKPRDAVLNFHSSVFRYLLYDIFIRDYGHFYDNVMFTDVRDVLFQANPFVWTEHPDWGVFGDKIYVFGEDSENGVGWNGMMYYNVFRQPNAKVERSTVLCSGTTMASMDKARLYLKHLLPHLEKVPDHTFGFDQAIHNHIIYTELPEDSVKIFRNREGPVRTVGLEGHLPSLVDGLILLPDKSIVNVVHQWTRIPMYDNGSIKRFYECPTQSVGY